jgi:hypothetical protein
MATRVARLHDVDEQLVLTVIVNESHFDAFAVSPRGAMGLMQLMPETAARFGVDNAFNPIQNVDGGVRYLKDLLKRYNGDVQLVLSAYDADQKAAESDSKVSAMQPPTLDQYSQSQPDHRLRTDAPHAEQEDVPGKHAAQADHFTVGSTKVEVLMAQGTPTNFNGRAWKYGLSVVYFDDKGRVSTWDIAATDPLNARLLPPDTGLVRREFFTVGSTKDEVLAAQGTPTELSDRAWKYGLSAVYFDDKGRVSTWDIAATDSLKARLLSSDSGIVRREFFTVGSTKDEVLAAQGTPTGLSDRTWKYGLSAIYFDDKARVSTWDIAPTDPLNAKLIPSRYRDSNQ